MLDVSYISLEKSLVGLVSENKLYKAFQGAELKYFFQDAFSKTKLLRFANRREIKGQLEKNSISVVEIYFRAFNKMINRDKKCHNVRSSKWIKVFQHSTVQFLLLLTLFKPLNY